MLRESIVANRFEALRGSKLTRLVGRDEEIDLLLRRWARAKVGDSQIILVSGEAGIGQVTYHRSLSRSNAYTRSRIFPCATSARLITRTARCSRSSTNSAGRPGSRATILPVQSWRNSRRCWPALPTPDEDVARSSLISCRCRLRAPPSAVSVRSGKRERTLFEALIRQLDRPGARNTGCCGIRGCALGRSHLAGAARPHRRTCSQAAGGADRDVPPRVQATPWAGEPRVSMLSFLNRLDRRDRAPLW